MSSNECWAKLRTRLGVLSDESSEIRTSNIGVCCSSIALKRFTMFCLSLYEGMPTVIPRTLASSPRCHLSFVIDYWWCYCENIYSQAARQAMRDTFAAAKRAQRRGKLQGNICLLGPTQKPPG